MNDLEELERQSVGWAQVALLAAVSIVSVMAGFLLVSWGSPCLSFPTSSDFLGGLRDGGGDWPARRRGHRAGIASIAHWHLYLGSHDKDGME